MFHTCSRLEIFIDQENCEPEASIARAIRWQKRKKSNRERLPRSTADEARVDSVNSLIRVCLFSEEKLNVKSTTVAMKRKISRATFMAL
jgi:hypothetical protein